MTRLHADSRQLASVFLPSTKFSQGRQNEDIKTNQGGCWVPRECKDGFGDFPAMDFHRNSCECRGLPWFNRHPSEVDRAVEVLLNDRLKRCLSHSGGELLNITHLQEV